MANNTETTGIQNPNNAKVDTVDQMPLIGNLKEAGIVARPTSIESSKGSLEPLRSQTRLLENEHIHIVHILFFIGALFFLFAGMWKFGKKTKF